MSDPVDDFLMHYGVKGMKWGTRKGLKAANDNFGRVSIEVGQRQMQARYNSTLSEASYRKLDDNDIVIAKGNVVKRTSQGPGVDSSYRDLFVSTNEADAAMYRGTMPTTVTGGIPAKQHIGYYETAYAATSDLKSPSEKKRVDAYIRLMDVPEIRLGNGETVNGREYMRRQGLGDTVNTLTSKELALTYYGQLAVTQGIHNDPINTAYFNSFRNQGYNALVDDNDRGIFSEQPLLVFDAQKHLQTVAVKQLTTAEIQEAQATLSTPKELKRHE